MINDLNRFSQPTEKGIELDNDSPVHLKVEVSHDAAFFFYSYDEKEWHRVAGMLNTASCLMNTSKKKAMSGLLEHLSVFVARTLRGKRVCRF